MKNISKIVLLPFLVILLSSCSAQSKNEYESLGLKGKIKRVLECSYYMERQAKNLFYCLERKHDSNGKYLEFNRYNADNELAFTQSPVRNSDGSIAEEKSYDKNGNLLATAKEKILSNERKLMEIFNPNGEKVGFIERFMEDNRVVKAIEKRERGETATTFYFYDKENLSSMKIITKYANADDEIITFQRYEYLEAV